MLIYERELDKDVSWALEEGGLHFEGRSAVHQTLEGVCRLLDDRGIPYAVAGAMAMFLHGYRRFTEDVDLVVANVSEHALEQLFRNKKHFNGYRDETFVRFAATGVRVDFVMAGHLLPNGVRIPTPDQYCLIDGLRVLRLPQLVDLKIARGTLPGRISHLGDVQEMIKTLKLPVTFAEQLHPSVRDQYLELWQGVADAPRGADE